jgi:hypothetical protein
MTHQPGSEEQEPIEDPCGESAEGPTSSEDHAKERLREFLNKRFPPGTGPTGGPGREPAEEPAERGCDCQRCIPNRLPAADIATSGISIKRNAQLIRNSPLTMVATTPKAMARTAPTGTHIDG